MEVLDFEVPAEWQFAADAYPTAAKRLVSSLASGKKKSNKHISEERLEDVISKTVHLPSMAADAGKPNAEKEPAGKKARKGEQADAKSSGAAEIPTVHKQPAGKDHEAKREPVKPSKPGKQPAPQSSEPAHGGDDERAMLAALSAAMQKQDRKRVSFEPPGGDAGAGAARPGKKQKQEQQGKQQQQQQRDQKAPAQGAQVVAKKEAKAEAAGRQKQAVAAAVTPGDGNAGKGKRKGADGGMEHADNCVQPVPKPAAGAVAKAGPKQPTGDKGEKAKPGKPGVAGASGPGVNGDDQQEQGKPAAKQPTKELKKDMRQPPQQQQEKGQSEQGAGTQKPKQKQQQGKAAAESAGSPSPSAPACGRDPGPASASASGGSGLLDRMRAKLSGGHFRYLNEQLYTHSGGDAFSMMQKEPALFKQYHDGFQSQTRGWPKQPLDVAMAWLKARPKEFEVADFGCGDARLAKSVQQKVHSFDLVASAPGVIACNMAAVPLPDASVDVAVFSLALMGTDYGQFLLEATRVLKYRGWLWIAEVRSRFASGDDDEGGPAGPEDFQPFLRCLAKLGYTQVSQDASNRMFVVWVLRKTNYPPATAQQSITWPALKACMYKKR